MEEGKCPRGENPIAGFIAGAVERNWDVLPLHFIFPGLAGRPTDEAHEWAKETFLKTLRDCGHLEGLVRICGSFNYFMQIFCSACREDIHSPL
jgi:hypothetical protein